MSIKSNKSTYKHFKNLSNHFLLRNNDAAATPTPIAILVYDSVGTGTSLMTTRGAACGATTCGAIICEARPVNLSTPYLRPSPSSV